MSILTTPNLVPVSPFIDRTRTTLDPRTHFLPYPPTAHKLRGSVFVTRLGFRTNLLPDPDSSIETLKDLFGRAEAILYTIADAAVSNSDTVTTATKQNNDWLSGITNYMESVLKVLEGGLSTLRVPYAYGFAIILLTVLVKAATFPLTKKQVESTMAMRSLQPQIKAIQQRYEGDPERIQLETARLYKLAGINPFAGCLPTLATIPVWIGLYRALSNVADEGLLSEGFFWIPSLAGPTTVAARQNGSGISWLFPFVDGHPPLGWSDTLAYLVLPVLLVASQYISVQIMQKSQPQSNDPNMKTSQAITKFLPLMIGYFALSVPSGLSLYWLTNNILSTAQQVWLQKLGGAKNPVIQLKDSIVKEEPIRTDISVPEPRPAETKAVRVEKLTPEGLRPGERFKQLKEQEARRRQQREEERRKAEEAAARELQSSTPNGSGSVGTSNRESSTATHDASTSGVVNGNLNGPHTKKDGKTVSATSGESTEIKQEEVLNGSATTANRQSEESQQEASRE